jgi:hypothetical protein
MARKIVYMFQQWEAPHWFRPALPQDYPVEYWQPHTVYSTDTVFYYDMYGPYHDTIQTHLDCGHQIVFDAKNEHYLIPDKQWVLTAFAQHPGQGCFVISGDQPQSIAGVHVIATQYWYWIMDQPSLRLFQLDQYQPQLLNQKKKFFMSIGLHRPDRDYLYNRLGELLNDSIHSYRDRGVFLPDDWRESQGGAWQRYINTDWLNQTAFTLVAETFIDDQARSGVSLTHNDGFFLCEKSYKPMACKHPILMASTQGNLAYLRSQGFETFPELWDETYDDIPDWRERINRIVEIVRDFDPGLLNTPVIKQKLLYNSTRFFDQSLTKHLLNTTIIEPVLEFVNA